MQGDAHSPPTEVFGKEAMKFLVDTNPPALRSLAEAHPNFVAGQLLCPVHGRSNWGGAFAMDNSSFTKFDAGAFMRMQKRNADAKDRCLFVTCPDIVGSMRRTLEVWRHRERFAAGFPLTLVLQNGAEDLDIPWHETQAIFIGGVDPWKESNACRDLIKTAKVFGLHVHCGRVNQIKRFEYMAEQGVDTCDGSGAARFGFGQLLQIVSETNGKQQRTLFREEHQAGTDARPAAEVEV